MRIESVVVQCNVSRSANFQSAQAGGSVTIQLAEGETYDDALNMVYPSLSRTCGAMAMRRLAVINGVSPEWADAVAKPAAPPIAAVPPVASPPSAPPVTEPVKPSALTRPTYPPSEDPDDPFADN